MTDNPRIELITLGDELLLGIRENMHLQFIGAELERHGLVLQRNTTARDNDVDIKEAFLNSWSRSDIVITTGGISAIFNNNAREALAEALGVGLEFVPEIEKMIEHDFAAMNRRMGKRYMRQCYKLEGSELLLNDYGTGPGIWFEQEGKLLIMLPGMPSEMRPMFRNKVLPKFQDMGMLQPTHAYFQLRTIGINETDLEKKLAPIYEKYAGLAINYSLYQGIIDVRLSSDAVKYSWKELERVGKECRDLLGEDFFAYGHDTLAEVIFEYLRAMEKTVTFAESSTGGKLSDSFTNIVGASQVFKGGVICYNNEAKIHMLDIPEALIDQHGAVSAEVAVAMATGVAEQYGSDYGLSVTGFAGPGDSQSSDNPVGTIYIGYYSPSGVWAHKVMYPGQREAVKVRSVNAALDWMRRKLEQDRIEDYMADIDLSH